MKEPFEYFTKSDIRRISSLDWRKIKRARTAVVKRMQKDCDCDDLGDCLTLYANIAALKNSKREAKINRLYHFRQ